MILAEKFPPFSMAAKAVPASPKESPGGPMPCPSCGHAVTAVKDSRPREGTIRRRRRCLACDYRFNTFEVTEAAFRGARQGLAAVRRLERVRAMLAAPVEYEGEVG